LSEGITLDAGALIALDRNDRRVVTMLAGVARENWRITVPAAAFAQAMRHPGGQVRLRRLINDPATDFMALDESDATAVGILLASTRTADIADAHVVICAERAQQSVMTSDPDDLRRLAPELELVIL
jgi:hypothetical protein